jgi:hypothetical protein
MGGVYGDGGLDYELDYFTERSADPPADHVTAVVAWRGGCRRAAPPWTTRRGRALAWLRGALGRPDAGADWLPPPGWDAASDLGGPREVLHSGSRRAVRVGGREYAFPTDGRTLVLLVDDQPTPGAGEPSVTVRAVTVPPRPPAGATAALPEAERLPYPRATSSGLRRAVLDALASDPVARAFLPPEAWRAEAPPDPAAVLVHHLRGRG